eukprot:1161142-Pelagomonas_calceolata.AAC.7
MQAKAGGSRVAGVARKNRSQREGGGGCLVHRCKHPEKQMWHFAYLECHSWSTKRCVVQESCG